MIKDWIRPNNGDDTSNNSKEVNLFNTDIEKLRSHYTNIFGLDNQE
jgi:hypothetical protein